MTIQSECKQHEWYLSEWKDDMNHVMKCRNCTMWTHAEVLRR